MHMQAMFCEMQGGTPLAAGTPNSFRPAAEHAAAQHAKHHWVRTRYETKEYSGLMAQLRGILPALLRVDQTPDAVCMLSLQCCADRLM